MTRLVVALLLLVSGPVALAEDVVTAVTTEGADPEALIRTAATRMRQGDLDGAALLLDQVDDRDLPRNLQVEAAYQRANVEALRRRYPAARDQYQAVLDGWPDSHRAHDARFRVAELTGVLGEPREALRTFNQLRRLDDLEPADQAKIAFNRAIFTLESGRNRRGHRRLARALARHPTGVVSYYEAKAWYTLVDHELDRLDVRDVRGSRRRMTRVLTRRIEGYKAADEALRETVALEEPEWILAGLIRLADAWEDLGDDILAAEEPELTPEQLRIYREELRVQAEGFWMRGLRYLEAGVDVSERLAVDSARVQDAVEARDSLMQKIEGP